MSKPKPKVTAYIDADILMYRAASFCLDEWEGEPAGDKYQARYFFDRMLQRWLNEVSEYVDVIDYKLVFTVGKNFRKKIFPEYKANRKLLKTWPALSRFKKDLLELPSAEWEDGIEADDLCSIRVTQDPTNRIVLSVDKDFRTSPVRLYVPSSHGKDKGEWYETSEEDADINWLRQAMTGDTTDNYRGIEKFGPARALKVLPDGTPPDQLWKRVSSAFQERGYTEDYAILMAQLARILRAGEYDFETKEVRLWYPPVDSRNVPTSPEAV